MGFDLPVFLSAGIQDALSPMQLAIAGIFALMVLCLRQGTRSSVFIPATVFIMVLVPFSVMFDLKIFDTLVASAGFLSLAKWVFLALSIGFFIVGSLFLWQWRMDPLTGPKKFAAFIPPAGRGSFVAGITAAFLAGICSLAANIWPVNYQVLLQSEFAWAPGRFFYSLMALCVYEVCRNAGVIFALLFFILACREKNREFLRQRRSLLLIIAAAVYLAVGASLFFFFYVTATKPWF